MRGGPQPPIGDYALIGNGRSVALVSRGGSIDWCCLGRIDRESCFGRLIDWARGGFCRIAPTASDPAIARRYVEDTLVLETRFTTAGGEVRLVDCVALRSHSRAGRPDLLLRVAEGVRGEVELEVEVRPRFEYGLLAPWVRAHGDGMFTAIGGADGLVVFCDGPLRIDDPGGLRGRLTLRAGERVRLAVEARDAHRLYPGEPEPLRPEVVDQRVERTVDAWRQWSRRVSPDGLDPSVAHSARVIRALADERTGAIAAAATTSLPERVGGPRNWDYRFSWIRDSVFALRSLSVLGFHEQAQAFRMFIERSTAGHPAQLQVMYGVGGEHRLTEVLLDLEGYRGSKPVRIGNAAWAQRQHDIYGFVLELAWDACVLGRPPTPAYWQFLCGLVERVLEVWREPDRGIWEVRGRPRHFTYSKMMCWAAVDRALDLAQALGDRQIPRDRWTAARDEIRRAIETQGYDAERGVFVQAFGEPRMDAALLLLPQSGFVPYDDPRMCRTADAVRDALTDAGGLVRRYDPAEVDDGLPGTEGAFLACTFWLAECLAAQGRLDEARPVFDRAARLANDVGLFSEQWDSAAGEMLGNFPQTLTHLAHIAAAVALAKRGPPEPPLWRGLSGAGG
jgi:GH15 family glucan-1,4-alpha-glucosidase